MKKLLAATGLILITCVCAEAIYSAPVSADPPPEASSEETQSVGYLLRDYNGKIAVFKAGEDKPLKIASTHIASLPKQDAKKLKAGISADTRQELEKALEDYCS